MTFELIAKTELVESTPDEVPSTLLTHSQEWNSSNGTYGHRGAQGTWSAGAAPYLTKVNDFAETPYGEWLSGSPAHSLMGVRLAAAPGVVGPFLMVSVRIKPLSANPRYGSPPAIPAIRAIATGASLAPGQNHGSVTANTAALNSFGTYYLAIEADDPSALAADIAAGTLEVMVECLDYGYQLASIFVRAQASLESVPFGRTGCCLLPDGSYLVGVYSDTQPTDIINIWKVSAEGTVLGHLVIDTEEDEDGRVHLIALDGFLAQALYTVGHTAGGRSYVLDASGDIPTIVNWWPDTTGTTSYGSYSGLNSVYLRASGAVVVAHSNGISLYRRGRPIMGRSVVSGGEAGIYPHPTDPYKVAVWVYGSVAGADREAYEITVLPDSSSLDMVPLGVEVPDANLYWMVGGGSPYAEDPIILQEDDFYDLVITTAAENDVEVPANILWRSTLNERTPHPLTGEAFWSTSAWGVDQAVTAEDYWVGAAPRLTDADDATYAYSGTARTASYRVVGKLPAFTLNPSGGFGNVEIKMRILATGGGQFNGHFHIGTDASSTPIASVEVWVYGYMMDSWYEIVEMIPHSAPLAAAVASGDAVVWYESAATGTHTYSISQLEVLTGPPESGINSDVISAACGEGVDRWIFCHEAWWDSGPYDEPWRSSFTARVGLVDNTSGTPVVEILDLEYDLTSPAGYPDDYYPVSLNTGSMSMTHRNGEIVVATCVVQQEGAVNYYSVVSWKLTGGDVAPLSRLEGGEWNLGINNGGQGLTQESLTDGVLVEAGEGPGLDAPAQPLMIMGSDKWLMYGRFTQPLREAVYVARNINELRETPLARSGEGFWNASWGVIGETATHYWVGGAPRLTATDEASYSRTEVGDGGPIFVGISLPSFSISATLWVTAKVRFTGTWPGGTVLSLGLVDPSVGLVAGQWDTALNGVTLNEWHTVSVNIPFSIALGSAATAGTLVAFATGGATGGTDGYDIAYLDVTPTKLWQGDNYGTVVGTNPLDVYDGDTAYVEVSNETPTPSSSTEVTFDLVHESGPVPPTAPTQGMALSFDIGYQVVELRGSGTHPSLEVDVIQEDGAGNNMAHWLPFWTDEPGPGSYMMTLNRGTSLGRPTDEDTPFFWPGEMIWEDDLIEGFIGTPGALPLHFSLCSYHSLIRVTYFRARLRWFDAGLLLEPPPPTMVEVVYELTDINTDLAAAQTLAGATFSNSGKSWGAFVAQGSAPAAADLTDGSDATFATLAHPDNVGGPVEVFTGRLTPTTVVPPGAVPYQAAATVRAKAGAASGTGSWLDGMFTVNGTQGNIRGQSGLSQLAFAFDLGPAWMTKSYSLTKPYAAYNPQIGNKYEYGADRSLETALTASSEAAAGWFHDYAETGAYLTFQSASTNPTQGSFDMAEFSITIRYLVP